MNHTSYCNYTKRAPPHSVEHVGRGSLIKPGNVSSVDSKPRLYLRETWHCVWAYYWCTVRHSSLGWDNGASVLCLDKVGTSEVSLPNCHACVSASERYRLQAVLPLGMERLGCGLLWWMCREAGTWNTAAFGHTKTAFSPHLQDFRNLNTFNKKGEATTERYLHVVIYTELEWCTHTYQKGQ